MEDMKSIRQRGKSLSDAGQVIVSFAKFTLDASCGRCIKNNDFNVVISPQSIRLNQAYDFRLCWNRYGFLFSTFSYLPLILQTRKAIPCHINNVSCGKPCQKELPCKIHKCPKICHKVF